jgi:predicted Zn-dependent protease
VHTGLLATADNEAQLASVIAHEVGHIEGRHLIKQLRQNAIAASVAEAAGLDNSRLIQLGVELAVRRPRSRQDEYQADELGFASLGRAGYAQAEMVAFMEKLLGSRSAPTVLSTHPATDDRIRRLEATLDTVPGNRGDGQDDLYYSQRVRRLRS